MRNLIAGAVVLLIMCIAAFTVGIYTPTKTEDNAKQMECITDAQVESVECHEYLGIPMPTEFTSEGIGQITLITDNVTGCQYLIDAYRGGITPRMYSDGIQVCGQSTYPNGEHDGHLSD